MINSEGNGIEKIKNLNENEEIFTNNEKNRIHNIFREGKGIKNFFERNSNIDNRLTITNKKSGIDEFKEKKLNIAISIVIIILLIKK